MTNGQPHPNSYNRHGSARRGIALMLVLMVMGVAVILCAALLTSDDSTATIADNALSQTQAEWAAQGASAQTLAAIEEGVDASTNAGDLMTAKSMGSATVEVKVTTMSGDAPSDEDRELLMTALARVKGLESRTTRHLVLPTRVDDAYDAVDPHLREFAIFAEDRLYMGLGSAITTWSLDPRAKTWKYVDIGLGFESSSKLSTAETPLSTTCFYTDATAGAILNLGVGILNVLGRGHEIDTEIPAVPAALPAAISALPTNGAPVTSSGIAERTVPVAAKYADCNISNGSTVTFSDVIGTHYQLGDVNVATTGAIVADGDIMIHVRGDLVVQNGGIITLADDDSRLTILVNGAVIIDSGSIGVPLDVARSGRGIESMDEWVNPWRIAVYGVRTADGGDAAPNWWINNNSSVVACWHAPNANFQLSNSTLAGRVTAGEVVLQSGGKLLSSPSLNRGVGFTAADGPLYQAPGQVTAGVAAILNTFDPADGLTAFNAALRGVAMTSDERIKSATVDADAADLEKRASLADAVEDK